MLEPNISAILLVASSDIVCKYNRTVEFSFTYGPTAHMNLVDVPDGFIDDPSFENALRSLVVLRGTILETGISVMAMIVSSGIMLQFSSTGERERVMIPVPSVPASCHVPTAMGSQFVVLNLDDGREWLFHSRVPQDGDVGMVELTASDSDCSCRDRTIRDGQIKDALLPLRETILEPGISITVVVVSSSKTY